MTEYDIAISFAEEDRNLARTLAGLLFQNYRLRVFYDDYEQAILLGSNLAEYLIDIYKNKARYCVILVSKAYKEKRWTKHEWRAAQARALEEPDISYILPIRVDNTELLGLLPTVGYISLEKRAIEEIAEIIYQKVSSDVELMHIVRLARQYYDSNNFDNAIKLLSDKSFDNGPEALRIRADSYGKLHLYEKAITELHRLILFLDNDFMSHLLLGIFYFRLSDFKKAIVYYEKANKIYPNHPTVQSDLAAAKNKLRKFRWF